MGFFGKVREAFRDKEQDKITSFYTGLQSLGISAQILPRGRPEESIRQGSKGLVDIPEGPIRWINLRRVTSHSGSGLVTGYFIDYGVPDLRLGPNSPKLIIKSVRIKNIPLLGEIVDLRWKGKDEGLGIIGRLNSDTSLKRPIMISHDVYIQGYGTHRCWIISMPSDWSTRWDVPSRDLWNCYQGIARHLLAEWSTQHKF